MVANKSFYKVYAIRENGEKTEIDAESKKDARRIMKEIMKDNTVSVVEIEERIKRVWIPA